MSNSTSKHLIFLLKWDCETSAGLGGAPGLQGFRWQLGWVSVDVCGVGTSSRFSSKLLYSRNSVLRPHHNCVVFHHLGMKENGRSVNTKLTIEDNQGFLFLIRFRLDATIMLVSIRFCLCVEGTANVFSCESFQSGSESS